MAVKPFIIYLSFFYLLVLYLSYNQVKIIKFVFFLFTVKDPKKIKRERISVHGFYRIGKVIGDGNFAVVRECKNRYATFLVFEYM